MLDAPPVVGSRRVRPQRASKPIERRTARARLPLLAAEPKRFRAPSFTPVMPGKRAWDLARRHLMPDVGWTGHIEDVSLALAPAAPFPTSWRHSPASSPTIEMRDIRRSSLFASGRPFGAGGGVSNGCPLHTVRQRCHMADTPGANDSAPDACADVFRALPWRAPAGMAVAHTPDVLRGSAYSWVNVAVAGALTACGSEDASTDTCPHLSHEYTRVSYVNIPGQGIWPDELVPLIGGEPGPDDIFTPPTQTEPGCYWTDLAYQRSQAIECLGPATIAHTSNPDELEATLDDGAVARFTIPGGALRAPPRQSQAQRIPHECQPV